jgi:RNase H-like domain found in reverse transcriptase
VDKQSSVSSRQAETRAYNKQNIAGIDQSLLFHLECDSSALAYGSVLLQRGTRGLKPVLFCSQKFTIYEQNYTVQELELLLIIYTQKNWQYLLEGARHTFIIFTEPRNLGALKTAAIKLDRHVRWSHFLARFEFELKYLPGKEKVLLISRQDWNE